MPSFPRSEPQRQNPDMMLRTAPKRASEMFGSYETPTTFDGARKPTSKHKRNTSKAKVTFKSQTRSNPSPRHRTTFQSRPTPATKRATSDATDTKPVTKGQSRFAYLFISLLAVSPMAIEYDAADEETMEAARKVSTQQIQSRKAYTRPVTGARPSEIRRTRWKRFKYELGLKMKSSRRGKAKERRSAQVQDGDVEMGDMSAEKHARR